jgi:hypothetical protein
MPKRPYPRHQRRHDAVLLSLLQNPLQTQKDLAAATGYSPSQISRIVCSPDFQAQYDVLIHESALLARSKWLNRAGASS